jgi:hypothetical protein
MEEAKSSLNDEQEKDKSQESQGDIDAQEDEELY